MTNIDDYVINYRTVGGQRVAESLATRELVRVNARDYVPTPLVYRGKPVLARFDVVAAGVRIETLLDAIRQREEVQHNELPGATVYTGGDS